MDWKEVLGGLAGSLPPGEENSSETPETHGKETRTPQKLHVTEERKGRKGKTATIIYGFTCGDDELQRIATRLKQTLGCGGSARCGEILLQGAVRDRAMSLIKEWTL